MSTVYCNKCFESKEEKRSKYFITNCFHVFCASCIHNLKNFCVICRKACKVLEINEHMPSEVKSYFDPRTSVKMLEQIVKVNNFQEMQAKAYVKRHYNYRKRYVEIKKKYMQLTEYRKKLAEAMRQEKIMIDKFKNAYETRVISPTLFQSNRPTQGFSAMSISNCTPRSSGYSSVRS